MAVLVLIGIVISCFSLMDYFVMRNKLNTAYEFIEQYKLADPKIVKYNEEVIVYNRMVSQKNQDLLMKEKLQR